MRLDQSFIYLLLFVLTTSCKKKIATTTSYSEKVATNTVQQSKATAVSTFVVPKDALKLRPAEGLVYFKNEPFTGTSLELYTPALKACTIQYVNGKKEGVYKKWFPNQELSYEAYYLNGKQHGTSKSWWNNGVLRSASHFKNGVANGDQWQWYKSSAKFKHQQLVDGKEEGLQKAWRENGKIYNNYEAKNGRIFGLKRANLCFELEEEVVQVKQ